MEEAIVAVWHHPILFNPPLLEYQLLHRRRMVLDKYGTGVNGTNTVCLLNKLCELIDLLPTELREVLSL